MSRFQRFDLHQLARKERCQLALLCFALCLRFWSAHAAAFKQSEPRNSGHSVSAARCFGRFTPGNLAILVGLEACTAQGTS